MIRVIILSILGLLTGITVIAQYTLSGKIEYERKTNVYAVFKDYYESENGTDSWTDWMKSSTPQFNINYFDLVFDTTRSIYKPGKEVEEKERSYYSNNPAADNWVLTDFKPKKVRVIKNVFEQKFFVEDSIRKMDWKYKDEIRSILNFKCHKAVGRICDSVYVVAFYTEDIIAGTGPEMFGGLPGMILELAIPRLHTTWTADKIELMEPQGKDFVIEEKGKKVNEKELYEIIQNSLKDWGKWGTRYIWWTVL